LAPFSASAIFLYQKYSALLKVIFSVGLKECCEFQSELFRPYGIFLSSGRLNARTRSSFRVNLEQRVGDHVERVFVPLGE
jgi:hypothetical protein